MLRVARCILLAGLQVPRGCIDAHPPLPLPAAAHSARTPCAPPRPCSGSLLIRLRRCAVSRTDQRAVQPFLHCDRTWPSDARRTRFVGRRCPMVRALSVRKAGCRNLRHHAGGTARGCAVRPAVGRVARVMVPVGHSARFSYTADVSTGVRAQRSSARRLLAGRHWIGGCVPHSLRVAVVPLRLCSHAATSFRFSHHITRRMRNACTSAEARSDWRRSPARMSSSNSASRAAA